MGGRTPAMLFATGEADRTVRPMRKAIVAIKAYQSAEGAYRFDENGDGLRGYNIVRNDGGRIVFARRIEFSA